MTEVRKETGQKEDKYDVIVVGTGAAGLFFALSVSADKKILMITKDQLENSDSYLAQGGICTLQDPSDFESFFEDTMSAGHHENNPESVKIMIEESPQVMKRLMEYHVEFDRNENGDLDYTREGAHAINRILHHKDQTGKEITSRLIAQAKTKANITIMEYTTMLDIIEKDGTCTGIILEDANGRREPVFARDVVLATGGIGGLFSNSTNFPHISGDSFAMAMRHNIELENIHYIQIHPTTLYSKKKGKRFLISESVRGEGAILLNPKKERFVDELLPRDTVAEAIRREMKKFNTDHMYIQLVSMTSEEAQKRFPKIYRTCKEEGYDLATDMVPITPAQHYLMGGIKASTNGETSMKHLFAVGETACNGVHGANRLASNSLLESLVFAERAAALISETSTGDVETYPVDIGKYGTKEKWAEENKNLVMSEVMRKDPVFYDKWCRHKD